MDSGSKLLIRLLLLMTMDVRLVTFFYFFFFFFFSVATSQTRRALVDTMVHSSARVVVGDEEGSRIVI